ncbi:hypothetical protein [Marimonas arenosa]|uniref:Uncharacterized protein n=1 Tax=Marimonas arenosa TaxID=1795305 RepID=A0AAE3WFA4_9RHOB|nr:hypothetical protein [Marimonas arenosa]MDQ2091320.1 hypothetical protein [Marimonas arenosa]
MQNKSKIRNFIYFPLFLGLASLAAADCPGPTDLTRGLRLTYSGGATEDFRPHTTVGIIQSVYREDDGGTSRALLAQGLYCWS